MKKNKKNANDKHETEENQWNRKEKEEKRRAQTWKKTKDSAADQRGIRNRAQGLARPGFLKKFGVWPVLGNFLVDTWGVMNKIFKNWRKAKKPTFQHTTWK